MAQGSESDRIEAQRIDNQPRWKIFGTCGHLVWSYSDDQPYEVGEAIWCGPCNDDSSVESIDQFLT